MSEKKWYKLVFKQLQPLHIGMGSYGVINETRIFIPGWTMWGALTKAYNIKCKQEKLSENQKLFEEISCFYPCFDKQGKHPLLPEYKNGEFYLGEYSEDEFRALFVDTFVSTAIVPNSRIAKDESLHEINVILPAEKSDLKEDNKEKQLYWVGVLHVEEEKKNKFLKENELDIYVGGDSRYGLGSMKLVFIIEIHENKAEFKNFLKANYIAINDSLNNLKVDIELIVDAKGYEGNDLKIENPEYCYIPGHEATLRHLKLKKGVLYVK